MAGNNTYAVGDHTGVCHEPRGPSEAIDPFATKETKRTGRDGVIGQIVTFAGGIREGSVLVGNVQVTNKSLASFKQAAAEPNGAQQEKHYPLNTILLQEDPNFVSLDHKPDSQSLPSSLKPTSTAHLYYCRGNPQSRSKFNASNGSKSVSRGPHLTGKK